MDFFVENPPILAMTLLVLLLVLSVPVGIYQKRRRERRGEQPPVSLDSHFMGTGFDLTLLLFGLVLVIAIVGALVNAFA